MEAGGRDVSVAGTSLRQTLADALGALEQHGSGHVAAEVRERLDVDDGGTPTLVVCGEAKRGKSTLVNALLGRPGLSPVDVDVATATYVTFRQAAAGVPERAHIVLEDGERRVVQLDELVEWVAVGGRHRGGEIAVVGASVDLADTALDGLVLVDTPGVGGLDSSHVRLALHAIGSGDALLFVSDAGSELTRPELSFLESASERIDRVVFVVAKRDKHPLGWQDVVDRNRGLLTEHAPRFATAPMLAVSALLAEQATGEADPEVRDLLWRRSGLAELHHLLQQEVVAARGELAARNAARLVLGRLGELEGRLAQQVAAARADPGVQEEAEQERAALERLRENADFWQHDFSRDVERARAETHQQLDRTFAALQRRWSDQIAELNRRAVSDESTLEGLVAEFEGSIREAQTQVFEGHVTRASEVIDNLVSSLDIGGSQLPDPSETASFQQEVHVDLGARGAPADRGGWMTVMQAAMAGKFGYILAPAAVGSSGAFVVAGGVAYGAYKVFKTLRESDQERNRLQQWARETVTNARASTRADVEVVFRELRPEVVRVVQQHLKQRVGHLTEVINEAQRASQRDRSQRQARAAGLDAQRKAIVAQRERLEDALGRPVGSGAVGTSWPGGASEST